MVDLISIIHFIKHYQMTKKEAYKDSKLDEIAKAMDDTAAKAVTDAKNTDFYKMNQMQQHKLKQLKKKNPFNKIGRYETRNYKQSGTKDSRVLKDPRYPQI